MTESGRLWVTQEPVREIPLHGGNVSTVSRIGDRILAIMSLLRSRGVTSSAESTRPL